MILLFDLLNILGLRLACWILVENTVLAELLWEKNIVPAEKISQIWGKQNGASMGTWYLPDTRWA